MPAQDRSTQRVTVPDHVVYRDFPSETVVLNLQTGQYHGLNTVAGRMLQAAEAAPSLGAAVAELSDEYGQSSEQIWQDLNALLDSLTERGIVILEPASQA